MADLKQTYIFRIVHVDNLPYIVRTGLLHAPLHPDADPNYIQIGDRQLTSKRGLTPVPVGPGGTFRDYVAFYFGPRQPMLYCIKHGYISVTQRPMSEIIYMVSTIEAVVNARIPFVFYDGHAYDGLSTPYEDLVHLGEVDMKAVNAKHWNDPADPDLKRRKQAEFLVHRALPFGHVSHILTYDADTLLKVNAMLRTSSHQPKVQTQANLYF
jgi:hypothetical protein